MHKEKHFISKYQEATKNKERINVIIEVSLRMRENNPQYKQHICIYIYILCIYLIFYIYNIYIHSEP